MARDQLVVLVLLFGHLAALATCTSLCPDQDAPVLNCTSRDLKSVPSGWIHNYTTVDLSRNSIEQLDQLPGSPSVSEVILRHNLINYIVNSAFSKLPNLTSIDLSYNLLTYTSLSPIVFRGEFSSREYEPISVEILRLSHNDLHALSSRVFEHLPLLRELYLDHNPVDVLDAVTLLGITGTSRSLTFLDLSYCGFSTLPTGFLHTLSKLKTLLLSGNQLVAVPGSLVEASASLQSLALNDNPLTDVTFPLMEKLKEVNISVSDTLKVIKRGSFEKLPKLRKLRCSFHTALTEIEDGAFNNKSMSLNELHFSDTALLTMPEHLVNWERLSVINIRGNPWRCDCHLAWMTSNLVSAVSRRDPEQAEELKCAEPSSLRDQPLIKISLHGCEENNATRRRVTALVSILILLVASLTVMISGQWARLTKHPPLPPTEQHNLPDTIHYVRIFNPKE